MENKYYTPSIEEFHIGFEFEWKGIGLRETDTGEWTKTNLSKISSIFSRAFDEFIKWNLFRVKYLDREDIESLGFKVEENSYQEMSADTQYTATYIMKDGTTVFFRFISFLEIDKNPDVYDGRIDMYKQNTTRYDWKTRCWINEPRSTHIFTGTIKNKSELKVLLKQLGIDD